MKVFGRTFVVVIAVAAVAVGLLLFNLDRIIRKEVDTQATASLRLNTSLRSARAALLGGKLNLHDLRIDSPKGFTAVHMLTLDNLDVAVKLRELRQKPIHIKALTIDKPTLVIEQSGGALNFRKAMENIPSHPPDKEPLKFVIDDLKLQDAHVIVRPGLPGVAQEIDVQVPSLEMKDIGRGKGAQNGAAIKDVTMQIISALAEKAAQSGGLPGQLKALLHLNAGQVMGQLDALAQKQIRDALPGALGNAAAGVTKSPESLAKDPAKALEGLGDLGGNSSPKQRAGRRANPR